MNAHAPNGLTPSAVHHGDLIRAIGAEPDGLVGTAAQVFRAAGRDPSVNKAASRDLGQLVEQGFITREPVGHAGETRWALTDSGKAAMLGMDVAAGRAAPPTAVSVGGMPTLRWDQLRPSPLNPRKDFDSDKAVAKREELRQDIVQRGFLIQSLMVRPIDAEPGLYWIVAGENRYRAIGEAIQEGDLPEDFLIPVQVRAMSDLDHLLTATAENIRRSDLNHLEEAQAFADAIAMGQTPQTLADAVGRTDRFIQEHIRVLNKASEEAKAKFLAGESDWTTLRDSVKVPKHELALQRNPRLALLIVEIEVKARREGVDNETPMAIAAPPPGGVFADAEELGLLVRKPTPDNRLGVLLLPPAMEWLEDQGGDSSEDPARWEAFVKSTTVAALGDIGAMALADDQFGTTFLNAEPAPPPKPVNPDEATIETMTSEQLLILAEVGHKLQHAPVELRIGEGPPTTVIHTQPIKGAAFDAMRPLLWGGFMSFGSHPISGDYLVPNKRRIDEALAALGTPTVTLPYLTAILNSAATEDAPTVRPGLAGDDFSALLRTAREDEPDSSEAEPASDDLRRLRAMAAFKPTDKMTLALGEIADHVQLRHFTKIGQERAALTTLAFDALPSGAGETLAQVGAIVFDRWRDRRIVAVTDWAWEWLHNRAFSDRGSTRNFLAGVRHRAGLSVDRIFQLETDGEYATNWLDTRDPPRAAEPRSPAPDKDPADLDGAVGLALVEIAYLVQEEPVEARGGAIVGARVGAYHLDTTGTANKLVMGGYISLIQAPTGLGYLAVPTQKANDWIAERYPHGISSDNLEDLQALALVPRKDGARFVTSWLNPEPEQAKAPTAPTAETPKAAPSTPTPDPVMHAYRNAFDSVWKRAAALIAALQDEPTIPIEVASAGAALQAALDGAKPFLSKEPD